MTLFLALTVAACAAGSQGSQASPAAKWPTVTEIRDGLKKDFGYEFEITQTEPVPNHQSTSDEYALWIEGNDPDPAKVFILGIGLQGSDPKHTVRVLEYFDPAAQPWLLAMTEKASQWEGDSLKDSLAISGGTIKFEYSDVIGITLDFEPTGAPAAS